MRSILPHLILFLTFAAAVCPAARAGNAPAPTPRASKGATVVLNAVLPERLSLEPITPWVAFAGPTDPAEPGKQPLAIRTKWNLDRTRSKVVVKAYYEDPSGATILLVPSATPTGTGTFAEASPAASTAAGLRLTDRAQEILRQPIKPGVNRMASRTDLFELLLAISDERARTGEPGGVLTLVVKAY